MDIRQTYEFRGDESAEKKNAQFFEKDISSLYLYVLIVQCSECGISKDNNLKENINPKINSSNKALTKKSRYSKAPEKIIFSKSSLLYHSLQGFLWTGTNMISTDWVRGLPRGPVADCISDIPNQVTRPIGTHFLWLIPSDLRTAGPPVPSLSTLQSFVISIITYRRPVPRRLTYPR